MTALDEAVDSRPLTLVAAGPGAGKTVAVSDWARTRKEPILWISLDEEDNRPGVLWNLVGRAVQASGLLGETAGGGAVSPPAAPEGGPALLDLAIQAAAPFLILVLDDAHVMTDPGVLESIDGLLRHPAPGLRTVLLARSDPLLPLHRYRVRGQLAELRALDLAMTKSETNALLHAYGLRIPARSVAALVSRTEGWVAGLTLSALRMQGSPRPAEFASEFALDQGSVGEYLMEEVVRHVSAETRRLLVETSFLDCLTDSLAEAVTGIHSSEPILRKLARTNSFVVALDHEETWFRYHPLFAEVLRHLFARETSEATRRMRRRAAAEWYRDHDRPLEALRHAVEAEEWVLTAELLAHDAFDKVVLRSGRLDEKPLLTFERADVAGRLDPDKSKAVLTAQAAVAAASGRTAEARKRLQEPRGAHALPHRLGQLEDFALLKFRYEDADLDALRQTRDRLVGGLGVGESDREYVLPGLVAHAIALCAAAELWAGDVTVARQQLGQALQFAANADVPHAEAYCHGVLALDHVRAGRLREAKVHEDAGRAILRRYPRLSGSPVTALHLAAAASALYRADVGECASTLRLAHAALERTPDGALSGTAGILDAALLALAGDLGDAQGVLQALPPTKFGTLAAVRTAGLAALSVSLGRPKSALQLLQEIPQRDRVAEVLVATGYAYLALGESQAAQTTARKVITEAGIAAPLPLVIEALILSGLVADRDGAESTAVEQLSRAVGLAGSEQINLPFFLASGRLGSLLSRHAALADVWPTDLREGNRSPVNVSQLGFSRNALAEGLTARESAVMRWLGTTMTTAEIAEELCVSVNTVKTHIAAIYRKLPASNRRTAVARARELQLL